MHECSHAAAIYLLGGRISRICIGGRGVTMETTGISGIREIICALAGPIGSILLLTVAPRFPRTAICGFVHGIYNLLPLFPMDGGRILRCILYSFFKPPIAGKILGWSQYAVIAVILILGAILSLRFGIMPLLIAFLIFKNNPLAKRPFWRYNRDNINKEVYP